MTLRSGLGPRVLMVSWLGALSMTAAAQDADPFDPAASNAGDSGGLAVESPFLPGPGALFGVYTSIAEDTVVLYRRNGTQTSLVSQLVGTTLHGGYTFGSSARFDVLIPVYPWVDAPISNFAGPAFGDVRLQSTVAIVSTDDRSFSLAAVPRLALPTGNRRAFTRRGLHSGLTVALGGETSTGLDWTANIGITGSQASAINEVALGSSFDIGGALSYRVDDTFRVGGEADLSYGFPWGQLEPNARSSGRIFARSVSPEGVGLTVGLGTGLIPGVGAAEYRLFAGLAYAPITGRGAADSDNDGLHDGIDRCVDDPEDYDGYEDTDGCPEYDNDADGLLDGDDSCPLEPEDPDEFEDEDGCPDSDNDADTVLDPDDKCPNTPGLVDNDGCPDGDRDEDGVADSADECPDDPGPEVLNGCPDRDEDRVPDFRDKCPDDPIPVDEDPEQSDGCPKRVYISEAKIVITDKVYFETGKSVIKSESYSLLGDVAALINSADRIELVEVQGHTDAQGGDSMNQRLSEERAASVRTWLIDEGKVDAARLTAKGYGEKEPIDTNRTERGRARNRRVEFKITRLAPAPAPARTVQPKGPKAPPKPAPEPADTGDYKPDPWGTPAPEPAEDPWEDLPEPTGSPWDEE